MARRSMRSLPSVAGCRREMAATLATERNRATMIAGCHREIAVIEAQIRAGHPDLQGLCLGLADCYSMKQGMRYASLKRTSANVELARQCLRVIADIAERGSLSWDPAVIGHALQELSQVLLERTGTEDILFTPVPAGELNDLSGLLEELQFVDAASQEFTRSSRSH